MELPTTIFCYHIYDKSRGAHEAFKWNNALLQ